MEASLNSLVRGIASFSGWNHAQKIVLFGWFLTSARGQDRFSGADIASCYDTLRLEKPSSISPFLKSLSVRSPKLLLRDSKGWFLERSLQENYDRQYGSRDISVQIAQLLEMLPDKVPDLAEKDFLKEALICYRHGAFRAAIVMCWNLTYFHLCQHILKHHLTAFNNAFQKRFPGIWNKAKATPIAKYEDFAVDLKESETIEVAKSANVISPDIFKILDGKLDRRNSAAHPSSVHIGQLQAEEFIHDLITNVVLVLRI